MKKINTESKLFNNARTVLYHAAFAGGAGALDCVCIPFIYAVFEKKFRFMKPICFLGTYGLGLIAGYASANAIDQYVDDIVKAWNAYVDEKNQKDFVENDRVDASAYMVPKVEVFEAQGISDINDQIAKAKLFEFDSEEEAKAVGKHCADWIQRHGKITVNEIDAIRWFENTKYVCHVYTDGELFGWTHTGEIEQYGPNQWFLDFGAYDIKPNYYKSNAMNDTDLIKNDVKED